MEDPTVSGGNTLGLPNAEYIELYNRSDETINLEGFTLTIGSKTIIFPGATIAATAYLILSKTGNEELDNYGTLLSFSNFPTLTSAQEIVLKDLFGSTIDAVLYDQDWYRSSSKAGGGYALERINPLSPCESASNWTASEILIGGTPGQANTVLQETSDQVAPIIINAYPTAANKIRLTFSEAMLEEAILVPDFFLLEENRVRQSEVSSSDFSEVLLELEKDLAINTIQHLELRTTIKDCVGNSVVANYAIKIALPVKAAPKDIVINELLFNPNTGGRDFIELYNPSDKVIDLSTLVLINEQAENPRATPVTVERLLFPKEYVVFTESPAITAEQYVVQQVNALLLQDLPTLPDKEGNITLFTNDFATPIIIDAVDYSADWHTPLLTSQDGVSLERLQSKVSSQEAANWHSAAATSGYATPTAANSQIIPELEAAANSFFTFSDKTISPDGDGFADFLQIDYTLDGVGYSASVHIYDAGGRLVKKLAQNELLSTNGRFKWDGTTADGRKAPIGIYVLWIDYFQVSGERGQVKEAVVVAGRL